MNLTALCPYQALQEQLTSVVQEIGHLIDLIATAARGEAAQLGHKVPYPEGILLGVHRREVDGEVSIDFVTVPKMLVPGIGPGSMPA